MEQTVSFGDYRFDLAAGRLWSGAQELRLTPKASAVLKVLVENAGKPVSKKDLFASVWKDTIVTDDALTSCIQELRKAFADDAKQPRFIETRHRLGYRFAAELSQAAAATASTLPSANDSTAIAVLPFADMSPGHDQDYLCEGLAEELINALTQVEGLRVVSRTAAFQYRKATGDVREIGRQLSVGNLLEGSVQKSGDRLRITVQLIEVGSGYHRWSQRFDRKLEDVFAIQDDIAVSVVASLRGNVLSPREKQTLLRPHTGATAYEFYLRGRQCLPMRTELDLHRSAEMFQRAIELDDSYSPAFAGLATVHATLFEWFGSKQEDIGAAEHASQRALELSPDLAEAHVARGFTLSLSQRYDEASQEFDEAIRLAPNLFDAYYYYARSSFAQGNAARAAELFEKAGEARREDFQSPMLRALPLRKLGRNEEARLAAREGIRRAERILMLNPFDVRALSVGACALLDDGQPERALEWSRQALEHFPDDMSALINGACVHARLRHKEIALDLLERAFTRGWGKREWIKHDPDYDSLRDDPRFRNLLENLK
jgi:TolB-like protein/tetratricopeptide (TPR) repeat protein